MANKPVIIIGAGGHAKVLISTLKALERKIIGILSADMLSAGQTVNGIIILGNDDKVKDYATDAVELVNGIGSIAEPVKRTEIFLKFKTEGYNFARVIHPAAVIIDGLEIGEGAQIMAGAIVQTGCEISPIVIINTGAIVEHDCIIGAQGVKVGDHVVVGAGAVVTRNIPDGKKVVGNPANEIKTK
jgi:UDP-perosamine 4-acetyltransferase